MQNKPLKIIRASAGSGKTFRLAQEYVRILFEDINSIKNIKAVDYYDGFKNILAVTFTNKAAEEMRLRIIKALDDISQQGLNSKFLLDEDSILPWVTELDTEIKKNIKTIAKKILTNILHQYSYFTVRTIDSFVQNVVRNFAVELRLDPNFKIQLDQDIIINELQNILFENITNDLQLRGWLREFVISRLEALNEKWEFQRELANFMKFVFKEEFQEKFDFIKDQKAYSRDNLNNIIKICRDYITERQKFLAYKCREINFTDYYKKFLAKKRPPKISEECLEYLKNKDLAQLTSYTVLENLYLLGLTADIINSLKIYIEKFFEYPISEMNKILKNIIDKSDAPFIYEKIGQKFLNILIDEFQDTSKFQWSNFKPMVDNSLAQGKNVFLVGDIKQSIYRWRNSDWHIMLDIPKYYQVAEETLNKNWRSSKDIVQFNNLFFSSFVDVITVDEQNSITDYLISNIDYELISNIFSEKNVVQIPKHTDKKGYIEFYLYPSINKAIDFENVFNKIIETINNILNDGYSPKDIAILVRTNKMAAELTNYILSKNVNFKLVTSEALFLKDSIIVQLIISVLNLINTIKKSDNLIDQAFYLKEIVSLYAYITKNQELKNKLFDTKFAIKSYPDFEQSQEDFLKEIEQKVNDLYNLIGHDFKQFIYDLTDKPIYQIFYEIIDYFKINQIENQDLENPLPYLRTLEDAILEFISENGADLKDFLDYWLENKDFAVDLPETDAVRVMTIHKAKGLEFPIVILPELDWQVFKYTEEDIFWAEIAKDKINKSEKISKLAELPLYPIKFKTQIVATLFEKALIDELTNKFIDSINLLYVAFTRAKNRLYAISTYKTRKNYISNYLLIQLEKLANNGLLIKDKIPLHTPSMRIKYILTFKNYEKPVDKKVDDENDKSNEVKKFSLKYSIKTNNIEKLKDIIKLRYTDTIKDILLQEQQEQIAYGQILHSILSNIHTLEQIDIALEDAVNQGVVTKDQIPQLKERIQQMLSSDKAKDWFSPKWKVYTETSIIIKKQDYYSEIRPDRILINHDAKQIIVIDFKFGQPEPQYHSQVRKYIQTLKQMYPKYKVEGFLLFDNGEIQKVNPNPKASNSKKQLNFF